MSGKKRGPPSNDTGLFGSSSGSLTSSLFGNTDADSTGIFGSSSASFAKAVGDRVKENEAKAKKLKFPSDKLGEDGGENESIESILETRKRRSELAFLDDVTSQAVHPESKPSKDQASTEETIPADVQIQETADVVRKHGFAIVENVVSRELLDTVSARADEIEKTICSALDEQGTQWRGEAETFRYYEVASRCSGRMDSRYETAELPFSDDSLVKNQSLFPLVNSLLGGATARDESHMPCLVYVGLILSFPGSKDQPWHQDGMPLFTELDTPDTPAYALNVFLPLTDHDMSLEAGPTEFIPGSHRLPEEEVVKLTDNAGKSEESDIVSATLRQGDALIYDYRVCHRGTSNLTDRLGGDKVRVRKILYLMYARPWFKEHLNFGDEKLFP